MKNELFDKIMVKEPYNILYDVDKTEDDLIVAKVDTEFIAADEIGPISCTESGRHLAILGSMALADKVDDANYYLAIGASMKRREGTFTESSDTYRLMTKVLDYDRKKGEVYGEVINDNDEVVYTATIQYSILKPAMFDRFFKAQRFDGTIENPVSPYIERRSFTDVVIEADSIEAMYGEIKPEDCEGHFHNYPALPVAIIANLFSEVAMRMFLHKFPNFKKVCLLTADLEASRLAFHGESLKFRGKIISQGSDNSMTFRCEGIIDDKVVAFGQSDMIGLE